MSYCGSHQLVFDYHYRNAWQNWRASVARLRSAAMPPVRWSGWSGSGPDARTENEIRTAGGPGSLALSGGIDGEGRWTLTHAQASSRGARAPEPGGAYALVLLDEYGLEVHREPLSAHAVSHGVGGGWAARVPLPQSIPREVAIVDAWGVTVMRTALPAVE